MNFFARSVFMLCVTTILVTGCVAPTAEALVRAGYRALEKGDLDEALRDFDDAVGVESAHADAYTGRGIVYLRKGDYERALREFDEALRFDPDSAEAYSGRGYAAAKIRQNFSDAYTDTRKAVVLKPWSAVFHSRYAYALACLGMFKDAVRESKRALELNEKNAEVWYNYGAVLGLMERREDALAKLKKAFQLDPRLKEAVKRDRDFESYNISTIK